MGRPVPKHLKPYVDDRRHQHQHDTQPEFDEDLDQDDGSVSDDGKGQAILEHNDQQGDDDDEESTSGSHSSSDNDQHKENIHYDSPSFRSPPAAITVVKAPKQQQPSRSRSKSSQVSPLTDPASIVRSANRAVRSATKSHAKVSNSVSTTRTSDQSDRHSDQRSKNMPGGTRRSSRKIAVPTDKPPAARTTSAEHRQALVELENLKRENEANKRKAEVLELELANQKSQQDEEEAESDGIKVLLKNCVKKELWPICKFITNIEDEAKATIYCLRFLNLDGKNKKGFAKKFVMKYGPYVTACLNDHRSYVQARIKEVAFKWMEGHVGNLPAFGLILACLTRVVKLEQDAQRDVMQWYWDKILPKAVGNPNSWDESKRYYGRISTSAPEDGTSSRPYVTSSDEAFAVIIFESCKRKWQEFYALKRAHGDKKIISRKHKPNTLAKDVNFVVQGDTIIVYGDQHHSKYTVPDAGQSKFGGWSTAGLVRFAKLMAMNKKARSLPASLDLETAVLEDLRGLNHIVHESHDEQQRAKRRKVEVVRQEVANVGGLWDDDDGEGEEVGDVAGGGGEFAHADDAAMAAAAGDNDD